MIVVVVAVILAAIATWYRITHQRPRGGGGGGGGMASLRAIPGEDDSLRVEVLNASSAAGMARAVTWRLRDRGIDVVYFGSDTAASLDSTEVLVRRGDREAGERVRRALGLGAVRVAPEPARLVDVTVRLGRDARATLVGDP